MAEPDNDRPSARPEIAGDGLDRAAASPPGIDAGLVRAAIHELASPLQYIDHSTRFLRRVWPALRALLEPQVGSKAAVPVRLGGLATVGDLITFVDAEVPDALDRIDEGTGQLGEHLRVLGQLAREDSREPEMHDPNQLVGCAVAAAHGALKHVVTVAVEAGEVPLVRCHPGAVIRQLSRALVDVARSLHRVGSDERRPPAAMRVATLAVDDHVAVTMRGDGVAWSTVHVVYLPVIERAIDG